MNDKRGVVFDDGSFAAWLTWLQGARDESGVILTTDHTLLERRFLEQTSAYYVAGPDTLQLLQSLLGAENVGVARLPSGPGGDGGPLLQATGLLFSSRLTESQLRLGLEVANYITSVESQTIVLEMANQVPTNIGLTLPPELPLAVFVDQTRTAQLLNNLPVVDALLRLGDAPYQAVLEDAIPPEEAIGELFRQLETDLLTDESDGTPARE